MCEDDIPEFSAVLDETCRLLSRGTYTPDEANSTQWFRSLKAHPIKVVRAAFNAHVRDPQRGRFVPSPADILAQIQAANENDGRPGPEEGWAIALRSADEFATVVWTEEIARAKQVAQPLLDARDEVAARMAFKEAYTRIVGDARAAGVAPQWIESLGFDAAAREPALQIAVDAGRIPALPAPEPQALLPGMPSDTLTVKARLAQVWDRYHAAQAERKPLQWAYDLKAREQSWNDGDRDVQPLTAFEREAWRNALEGSPQVGLTGFKPIPVEAWPPGMRPAERHAPAMPVVPVEAYEDAR